MNCSKLKHSRAARLVLTAAVLASTTTLACHVPATGAPTGGGSTPNLSIGAAQFPADDAIILRWEQHWTVERNGTVHRRSHQWLKLLNSRPIRRVADPRIDFVNGEDQLIIHAARTHLANGEVLPVPDYSFNIAAPNDIAGWPQYADWQQQIVSFSGIEKNVVLELDYEVVTPAGTLPWIDADLRLEEDYPTVERVISVTLPEGTTLHHRLERAAPVRDDLDKSLANGMVTYRWAFTNLPGARGEPQSPPWQSRCGRLRFTTAPGTSAWASAMLDRVDRAGQPTDTIKKFAESAVEDESDPAQRVRKVAKKVHDSFNTITSPKAMRSLSCRSAADVLRANYGNELESAVLCLAAVRSLGMTASVAVGVDANLWDESDKVAPTSSAFAGVVVVVDLPGGPLYMHPRHGVFKNPGGWGRHWLLNVDDTGTLLPTYVYARGEREPGELHIAGKITVDATGEATGELRIRATGAFFDPAKLETADAQKTLVERLVGRVLSDVDVPGHSVATLSDETFRATASVASNGAIKSLDKRYVLRLGEGPAFLPDVPMPLARSYRRTDVQLASRFRENIDLTIELPDKWKPLIVPASLATVEGPWGTVTQTVDVIDNTVRLRRDVAVTAERLTPGDFEKLRRAVNDLRANKSLLVVFGE